MKNSFYVLILLLAVSIFINVQQYNSSLDARKTISDIADSLSRNQCKSLSNESLIETQKSVIKRQGVQISLMSIHKGDLLKSKSTNKKDGILENRYNSVYITTNNQTGGQTAEIIDNH